MRKLKIILTSLLLTASMAFGMLPGISLTAYAGESHGAGWTSVSVPTDMSSEVSWDFKAIVNTNAGEAKYYLTQDSKWIRPLLIKSGTNVTICLHGHDIFIPSTSDADYLFYVEEGATLTIENCTTGGNVSNLNPSGYAAIYNLGTVNISDCSVGSSKYAIYTENGTVRISGEAIVDSADEAIRMTGGNLEISGFSEITGSENGIFMLGGNLTVYNASIKSTNPGSRGIYMEKASANILNGADIEGVEYGVMAWNDCKVQCSGGDIRAVGPEGTSIYSVNSKVSIHYNSELMSTPRFIGPIAAADPNDYTITAGYFSHNPEDYLSSAYKVINSGYSDCPFAVIEKDKYKVTFTNGAGKTISTQSVYEGCAAKPPADPTRSGYVFKSWDKKFSNITADLTVNALWMKLVKDLPAVKIAKPVAAKKAATVKWTKISKKNRKKIKKVEIQYSRNKKFKSGVTTKYASPKKTSLKIKGLKAKKTYYVRIRAYTKKGNVVHISKWSSVKRVKTK